MLPHAVGDIVPHGDVVLQVYGPAPPPSDRLRGLFAIGEERTIEQDPAFALRILVDIAIRALSPAVNDPTTTVQVLGAIEDLLLLIGDCDLRGRGELRDGDGTCACSSRAALGGPAGPGADGDPRVRRDRHAGHAPDARAARPPRGARPPGAPRGGRRPHRGTRVEPWSGTSSDPAVREFASRPDPQGIGGPSDAPATLIPS